MERKLFGGLAVLHSEGVEEAKDRYFQQLAQAKEKYDQAAKENGPDAIDRIKLDRLYSEYFHILVDCPHQNRSLQIGTLEISLPTIHHQKQSGIKVLGLEPRYFSR